MLIIWYKIDILYIILDYFILFSRLIILLFNSLIASTNKPVVAGHASRQAAREAASPSRRPANVTEETRQGFIFESPVTFATSQRYPRMEAAGVRRLICLICLIC